MARSGKPTGYSSGALARLSGVSRDTLRFYERRGLLPLPNRLANGYRRYAPEALDRVRLIQRALAVGFSLEELLRFVRARARGAPPCREVRALAAAKLEEIEARLREMEEFRDGLLATLESWDRILAETAPGAKARLLEAEASDERAIWARSPLSALRFQRRPSRTEKGK